MPEAYIYDHVRTPRGRGKADGALHEVTALALATVPLQALKERNNLAADVVDDVVLGVVDPVGEAGSDIARFAALKAGLGEAVPGVQISRFCASGLDAVNFAAAQVMSGQHELVIGGGAESMSRVGIGASGGAWPMDPSMAVPSYFMPQGVSADLIATKYGFSRDDVDAYAVQSQHRAAKRAMSEPASPTGSTTPSTTSSTTPSFRLLRSFSACSGTVASASAVTSCSAPSGLPRPRGVRT
jgi:acetyl-CoA C-acetyltransferase